MSGLNKAFFDAYNKTFHPNTVPNPVPTAEMRKPKKVEEVTETEPEEVTETEPEEETETEPEETETVPEEAETTE